MEISQPLEEIDWIPRPKFLALRRLGRPEVAMFLHDPQPALVTEAARAINDAQIEGAQPELAHMLGSVLKPHDIVPVEGIGAELSGPYQVQSVTHVINAADHFMDIKLRSNIGRRT